MARLSLPQQHDQDDDHGGEHSGEEHEPVQAAWALVHVSTSSPGLLAGLGLRFAAGYAAAGGLAAAARWALWPTVWACCSASA